MNAVKKILKNCCQEIKKKGKNFQCEGEGGLITISTYSESNVYTLV